MMTRMSGVAVAILATLVAAPPRAEARSLPHAAASRAFSLVEPQRSVAARASADGYRIGSPNTVTADPPIARPATTPCVVTLFAGQRFADFNAKPFAYAPPKACPGPWQKIVLVGDYSVSAGRQFDRTAEVSIANTNVYYGTTPEPSRKFSPSWHFERDLTDDAALLARPHAGEADLGNVVDTTYTGIEFGTIRVEFYPQTATGRAPRTPDVVLPIPNVPGGAQGISTPTSVLSQTYTLPRNVERAYLDVIAQSQSGDEFWYTCVPSDLAAALASCGNTAFRETDVTIDGRAAGIAPVYPWIYTGGIDPYLWRPIPGVQTLNFKPYRVDLTPFAAILADGKPHAIAIGVEGANNYFLATATLLAYLDRSASVVTGGLTRDTLSLAPATVTENVVTTNGFDNGSLAVTAARAYTIAGYAMTSHGRVDTTIAGTMAFSNAQRVVNSASLSEQDITQDTIARTTTTTHAGSATSQRTTTTEYPLVANISLAIAPNLYAQTTTIDQRLVRLDADVDAAGRATFAYVSEDVAPTDTLDFDGSFNLLDHKGQSSAQRYAGFGSDGTCFIRSIAAVADVLTNVTNGPCDRLGSAAALRRVMSGGASRAGFGTRSAITP